MLVIDKNLLVQMFRHAKDDYPNECCGVLIGESYTENSVTGFCKMANTNKQRASYRYLIDAKEHYLVDKKARADGLDIIGFYHSHPNSGACPSAYDCLHAWPAYTYLIISVDECKNTLARAWILSEDSKTLAAEEMRVV